jgi:hypothetical protein
MDKVQLEDFKRGWVTVEFAEAIVQIARENPDIALQARVPAMEDPHSH